MADGRHLAGHRVGDPRVGPELLQRADHVGAARARRPGLPSASTTGNSLWLVRSSVSTASSMCASGVSVANCVIMAAPTGTSRDIARIATSCASGGGREIDEDRDEDQQRIAEQAEEAEAERDHLADRGRDLGRAHIAEPAREQRAQHAAAVHREGRDQVEQHQEHVHRREPVDHRDRGVVHRRRGAAGRATRRTTTTSTTAITTLTSGPAIAIRNSSLGFSGMRSSCATPPIGSSVTSGVVTPKRARREDMAELVRQHAGEQQDHEREAGPRRLRTARNPVRDENPPQEQQERHMQAYGRAGDGPILMDQPMRSSLSGNPDKDECKRPEPRLPERCGGMARARPFLRNRVRA